MIFFFLSLLFLGVFAFLTVFDDGVAREGLFGGILEFLFCSKVIYITTMGFRIWGFDSRWMWLGKPLKVRYSRELMILSTALQLFLCTCSKNRRFTLWSDSKWSRGTKQSRRLFKIDSNSLRQQLKGPKNFWMSQIILDRLPLSQDSLLSFTKF